MIRVFLLVLCLLTLTRCQSPPLDPEGLPAQKYLFYGVANGPTDTLGITVNKEGAVTLFWLRQENGSLNPADGYVHESGSLEALFEYEYKVTHSESSEYLDVFKMAYRQIPDSKLPEPTLVAPDSTLLTFYLLQQDQEKLAYKQFLIAARGAQQLTREGEASRVAAHWLEKVFQTTLANR